MRGIEFKIRIQTQAGNQLGTLGGAKTFPRGAQIFELCPIVLNYVQHFFPGGAKIFLQEASPLLHPPGYGPV